MSKFAILPILSLAGTFGIFYIIFFRLKGFAHKTTVELEDIEEEKNLLAAELEQAHLENLSLKQKLQRYTALKGLTETLSYILSLDMAARLITNEAFKIVGKSYACLLYLVNRERQELSLVSTELGDPQYEPRLKTGDIFDNWVFKQRSRLLIEDTKKDFRFNVQDAPEENRGVRSLIAVPLVQENKLLGILRLDNVVQKAYDADDLRLLDIISDLASAVLQSTLLYQETERLAITDGLTGLYVHRYFQERFGEEICRALWRTDSQFAFLMLDIDNFKDYNDTYGHIAGDIVLKKIAQLITLSVTPGDIVARYGGEEFALLLVDSPKLAALKTAQRIRKSIEGEKFSLRRRITEVRISGGMSFFPEDGRVKEVLIQRADQALYRAKHEGKNRIRTT